MAPMRVETHIYMYILVYTQMCVFECGLFQQEKQHLFLTY